MALPATDNFNRANGAPGSNWAGSVGNDLTISSNEVTGATASVNCSMYWSADNPNAAQYGQAKISQTGAGEFAGPTVRSSATDWVCGDANGGTNWQIEWYNAGAFTVIASWATAPANGDIAKITASGSAFELFVNATSRASGSNGSAPSTGNGGIYIFGNSASSRVDDFEVGNGAWDGYANIEAGASTNGTSLSGGAALNMPSGIVSGHLLIAIASNDNTGGTNMGISGWEQLFHTQYTGNVVSHGVWAKLAAGSDTATLTGASQDYAARVIRITDHGVVTISTDIKVSTPATGSSSTPDPPSLDAGSSKKWLRIATNGSDDDDNTTPYAPTNYTAEAQVESAQSTSSTMIQVAYRKVEGQTEDPGTFALAAIEEWIANVIAIPPASTGTAAVTQVTETDTSQAIGKVKYKAITQDTETNSAQAVTKVKRNTLTQTTEADSAQAVTWKLIRLAAQTTEADTAQAIGKVKYKTVAQSTETETAQAITVRKVKAIAQVTATDSTQAVGKVKYKAVTQTTEADSAQAIGKQKTKAITQVTEADSAQTISASSADFVNQATETDTAQAIGKIKYKAIAQPAETDSAQAITYRKQVTITQVSENDLAQGLFKTKRVSVVQITETDTAQAITARKVMGVTQVTETDAAQPIYEGGGMIIAVGQAVEVDAAVAITMFLGGNYTELHLPKRTARLTLQQRTSELQLSKRGGRLTLKELD